MSLFGNMCAHANTSEADEMGNSICGDCGASVTTRLTPALFMRTCDLIDRDRGRLGSHSMRCVKTPEGFICADDCRMVYRQKEPPQR